MVFMSRRYIKFSRNNFVVHKSNFDFVLEGITGPAAVEKLRVDQCSALNTFWLMR